jgi:hypothetical protein
VYLHVSILRGAKNMNFDLISMAALATSAVVVSLAISAVFARTQWQRIGIAAGLASWFALVIALGATGYIGAAANRPGGLGLAVVLPLAILSVLAFGSKTARQRVAEAGLFPLISVQILRVLGILFVLSYARNELPAPFAPVAGWGDVTVGLAAIPLSLLLYSSEYRPRALLVAWNILGIADLVTALTLGALSSPGPIRMFWGGPSSAAMTSLPLILIPCFLVPCFLFLHFVTLSKISHLRESRQLSPTSALAV